MKKVMWFFVVLVTAGFSGCASSYVPTVEHRMDVERRFRDADAGIARPAGSDRVARYPVTLPPR